MEKSFKWKEEKSKLQVNSGKHHTSQRYVLASISDSAIPTFPIIAHIWALCFPRGYAQKCQPEFAQLSLKT